MTSILPTRPLGRTGEQVTIFGLGGEGVLRTHGRMAEAVAVIHRALDLGVNYYDSAPAYAGCLNYLGEGLAGRREGVFVASKTHDRSREGSLKLLDDTLARLGTDHLDLWQLHDLRTQRDLDAIFGKGGAMEALLEARDAGRVRYLGLTGHHDPAILQEAMRRFTFDTVLVALNAADRHRLSFIETVLPEANANDIGIIAMKVYGAGSLLGPHGLRSDEALSYALTLNGVRTAIVGCSSPVEVEENVRIATNFAPLSDDEMTSLEQRTAKHAATFASFKKPPFVSLRGT
ncbi:MAG: aldo/keto reductase [Planctomycetota bacterium]|nr:aldo/keto reductase [Planctomycetaceae bacterium]MDQ3329303.1 aldo/keto reductase [Planctomycetota bacterium]